VLTARDRLDVHRGAVERDGCEPWRLSDLSQTYDRYKYFKDFEWRRVDNGTFRG